MRKKRPIDRSASLSRDATLVVIASEDRYAIKQYFEFFRSTRVQFRVLETDHGESSPAHVLSRLTEYMKEFDFGEASAAALIYLLIMLTISWAMFRIMTASDD